MKPFLEESIQRYHYVSRVTFDAIWDWDIVKGTLYWGENFETIFGYKLAEVSPGIESWTSHICPDDTDRVPASIQGMLIGIEKELEGRVPLPQDQGYFCGCRRSRLHYS